MSKDDELNSDDKGQGKLSFWDKTKRILKEEVGITTALAGVATVAAFIPPMWPAAAAIGALAAFDYFVTDLPRQRR